MIPEKTAEERDDFLSTKHFRRYGHLKGSNEIIPVKEIASGKKYVLKIYSEYNPHIYEYLLTAKPTGVPGIHEIFECQEKLYVLEERVEGDTLEERVAARGVFDVKQAVDLILQLCEILRQFHSTADKTNRKPIIHRDLAPKNVMIGEDDKITLIDFNVSKEVSFYKNQDTKLLASANYAAPEQIGGYTVSDVRTDIFAIGGILIFLTTAEIPVEGIGYLSGELRQIVDKCLRKEKEERYDSVEQLMEALRSLLQEKKKAGFQLPDFQKEKLKKQIRSDAQKFFKESDGDIYEDFLRQSELYVEESLSDAHLAAVPEHAYLYDNLKYKSQEDSFDYSVLKPDAEHAKYRILMSKARVNETADLTANFVAVLVGAFWKEYAAKEFGVTEENADADYYAWTTFWEDYEKSSYDIYNKYGREIEKNDESLQRVLAELLTWRGVETVAKVKANKIPLQRNTGMVFVRIMMYTGALYAVIERGDGHGIDDDFLRRNIPVFLNNNFSIVELIKIGNELVKWKGKASDELQSLIEDLLTKCFVYTGYKGEK